MIFRTKTLLNFVASILISFAAITGPVFAATFMSEAELLATIAGNTLQGVSNSDNQTFWAQAYSAAKGRKNGKINGVFGGDKYKAKWSVANGQLCEDWGSGSDCRQVERVNSKQFRIYKDGKPLTNLWTMQQTASDQTDETAWRPAKPIAGRLPSGPLCRRAKHLIGWHVPVILMSADASRAGCRRDSFI